MPKHCIKNGAVINDDWTVIGKEETALPDASGLILPLSLWLSEEQVWDRPDIGVWFDSDEYPDVAWTEKLQSLPIIAVNFPTFTDGRGFTIGRMLRQRFNYQGELRAIGYLLRDQMCYMKRCGFNSFILGEHIDLNDALNSLNDFTEYYQCSVDQPQPLFRRLG
jgi:uncharacterized protein (DUF934 family)